MPGSIIERLVDRRLQVGDRVRRQVVRALTPDQMFTEAGATIADWYDADRRDYGKAASG